MSCKTLIKWILETHKPHFITLLIHNNMVQNLSLVAISQQKVVTQDKEFSSGLPLARDRDTVQETGRLASSSLRQLLHGSDQATVGDTPTALQSSRLSKHDPLPPLCSSISCFDQLSQTKDRRDQMKRMT